MCDDYEKQIIMGNQYEAKKNPYGASLPLFTPLACFGVFKILLRLDTVLYKFVFFKHSPLLIIILQSQWFIMWPCGGAQPFVWEPSEVKL